MTGAELISTIGLVLALLTSVVSSWIQVKVHEARTLERLLAIDRQIESINASHEKTMNELKKDIHGLYEVVSEMSKNMERWIGRFEGQQAINKNGKQ